MNSATWNSSSPSLPSAPLPRLDDVRAELARRSLSAFIAQAWHVLEPGNHYDGNWHIDEICRHLEAVADGTIRNLLINIPPGHMKSMIVAVCYPAWMWLRRPNYRMLFASYSADLSMRDSVKCRQLIQSDWYQETFQPTWQLSGDQNVKSYYANTATGFRLSLGVGGATTGFRGDLIVVDDPLNAKDQYSDNVRKGCLLWWDQAYANRLNDMQRSARVVIMQRLHEEDLTGHILQQETQKQKLHEDRERKQAEREPGHTPVPFASTWDHLKLQSQYVPEKRADTRIGVRDPRTERGELLFPTRFPQTVIDEEAARLLEAGMAGQHQQEPTAEGGTIFKVDRFGYLDALPNDVTSWCRFWDAAGTEDGGDWTVGLRLGKRSNGRFLITDVHRGQWSTDTVDREIRATALIDGWMVPVREEQEPGSSGKAVINARTLLLAGFDYQGLPSSGDKITRAKPFAAQVNAGNVDLYVNPATGSPWIKAYIEELRLFPNGKHDDQVDGSSGGFNHVALGPSGFRVEKLEGF
ncbi:MAG TPA: phage terminase large subunit [Mycobacterium sp.]|nr:phage terminase large subunit [Mycobacterium sp.]